MSPTSSIEMGLNNNADSIPKQTSMDNPSSSSETGPPSSSVSASASDPVSTLPPGSRSSPHQRQGIRDRDGNKDDLMLPTTTTATASTVISSTPPLPSTANGPTTMKPRPGNSISPIDVVVGLVEFDNQGSDQKLSFQPGDTIFVLNKHSSGWWDGVMVEPNPGNAGNKVTRGWFPCSYTRQLRDNVGYGSNVGGGGSEGSNSLDILGGPRSTKSSRSSSIVSSSNLSHLLYPPHSVSASASASTSTGNTGTRPGNFISSNTNANANKLNEKGGDTTPIDTDIEKSNNDVHLDGTTNTDINNKTNTATNNNNINANTNTNNNSNNIVNDYTTPTSNGPTFLTLPISAFSKSVKSRSRRSSILHSITNYPQSTRFPQIINPSNMANRINNEQPISKQNNSVPTPELSHPRRQQNVHRSPLLTTTSGTATDTVPTQNNNNNSNNSSTSNTASFPQKTSETEQSELPDAEKINILSLEEVKMIINSVHAPITATWTPLPVIQDSEISDNVIFYNKQLNIYCSEFPLVLIPSSNGVLSSHSAASVDEVGIPSIVTSVATATANSSISSAASTNVSSAASMLHFPDNDNLVDMSPRDLDRVTKVPPIGAPKATGDTAVLSDQNTSTVERSETEETILANGNSLVDASVPSKRQRSPEKMGLQPAAVGDVKHWPLNESGSGQNSGELHGIQPAVRHEAILSEDDLFYYHTKDVRSWLELEELTIHFVRMTRSMFLKVDRFNFVKFFNLVSNFLTYTQLACRLIRDKIEEKRSYRSIKKLLKQLISSLSRININSIIYFDSYSRFQLAFSRQDASKPALEETPTASAQPQQQTGLATRGTPGPSSGRSYFSGGAMPPQHQHQSPASPGATAAHMTSFLDSTILLVNSSTRGSNQGGNQLQTNKTALPKLELVNPEGADRINVTDVFSSTNNDGNNSVEPLSPSSNIPPGVNPVPTAPSSVDNGCSTSSAKQSGRSPEDSSESRIPIRSIFEAIDQEMLNLLKNIQMLHHILQTSVLEPNSYILPQVLPRFFKDSFNGGSWTNPFSTFITSADDEPTNLNLGHHKGPTGLLPPGFTSPRSLSESSSSSRDESDNNVTLTATSPSQGISSSGYDDLRSPFDYGSPKTSITNQDHVYTSNMPPNMERAVALAAGVSPNELERPFVTKGLNSCPSNASLTPGSKLPMMMGPGNSTVGDKNLYKSKSSKRKVKYPLNNETLLTMKKISAQINEKLSSYLVTGPDGTNDFLCQPRSKSRSLEINSKTYEQMSQNAVLIEILENLDLTIFMNLKKLIDSSPGVIDAESEEFLKHEMASISNVVVEFFDVKQAFHNISVRFIMATQMTTVEDPYIFSSMRSNYKVGFNDMKLLEKLIADKYTKKVEKKTAHLYRQLVEKDIENNDSNFLNTAQYFIESCEKYAEVSNAACMIVEQLIEERENLLNYAARMMKNGLIAELLTGTQENWFDQEQDEDDEEFYMDNGSTPTAIDQGYTEGGDKDDTDNLWFLQPTHEYTLIYDSKGRVKGGTKEALIEHLTNHKIIDPAFNVAMLISFRSIFTVKDFFYALIYRYNMYPPEGLNFDDYSIWIEKRLNPIKCRVINILKTFLQQYWNPCYLEPGLSSIESFVEYAVNENIPGAVELLQKVRELLVRKGSPLESGKETSAVGNQERGKQDSRRLMTRPLLTTTPSTIFHLKKKKLLHFDPANYARQLTIREHDLYLRITMFECLDRAWGDKYCNMGGSPNITKFIQNANTLTNFVSYSIVKQHFVKIRAQYIRFFITVAEHCKELNNFSSMTAIVSALYSSPIYRLKKTWEIVPEESKVTLRKLNNLMDSKKNFIRYRGLLRSVKDVACVPFFGVYLSDLTFTNVGNPDYLHGNTDIINFGKRSRIVDIIEEILSFKRVHYKLKRAEEILGIIDSSFLNVPHIEKQYKLSLEIEPRVDNKGNVPSSGIAGDTTSPLSNTKTQNTLQTNRLSSQTPSKFIDGEAKTARMESDRPESTPCEVGTIRMSQRDISNV